MSEKPPLHINPLDLVKLLVTSPGSFAVSMNAMSRENWQMLGSLERDNARVIQEHNFAGFENYLDTTPYKERQPLEELTIQGLLPPEILVISQATRTLLEQVLNNFQWQNEESNVSEQDLRDKAIYILMLELLYNCLFYVSKAGLSDAELEEGRPPSLDRLATDLIVLKSLYSTYFTDKTHVVTTTFIEKQLHRYAKSADAQVQLIKTFNESDEDKAKRQATVHNYQIILQGFEVIKDILS